MVDSGFQFRMLLHSNLILPFFLISSQKKRTHLLLERDIFWPEPLLIQALAELPLLACGGKKFAVDALCDHVSTCTAHSGAKKAHDWSVEQLADLFHTTHTVKTQEVTRSRGQRCGDMELTGYLANAAGPVPLVLDPPIAHERFGGTYEPSIYSWTPTRH
jgi:hypothetical protein